MKKGFLNDIGLTDSEIYVYLTLLKNDILPPGKIAEKTGIHRSYVYDNLNRLIDKGVVSHVIKSGKKHYRAANPERLISILKEKETNLRDILPELKKLYNQHKVDYKIEIFEGKEGIKSVYETALNDLKESKAKKLLSMGGVGKTWEILEYYMPNLVKRGNKIVEENNIEVKTIWDHGVDRNFNVLELGNSKILPKNFSMKNMTAIWGDKVVINSLEGRPFLVLIENKDISESYKTIFNIIWNFLD